MPTLEEFARARNKAVKAVTDWMNAKGEQGLLVSAGDCPDWKTYEEAENTLQQALRDVGTGDEKPNA